MTTFNVDASLFRVASMFQSSEETRYYLNGVLIEAHPVKGVFLVATDGHRMFVAHDESGAIDGNSVIVQLGKDQIKACKEARGDAAARRLIATASKEPVVIHSNEKPVSIQSGWEIDGVFPDWRRAMKGANGTGKIEAIDAKLMKSFGDAGEALSGSTQVDISFGSDEGPALVRFARVSHAVGVIMPVRWKSEKGWPSFLGFEPNPPVEPVEAVEEAA